MSTSPTKNMIGIMATGLRESCTHHAPTHPPGDAAHESAADVGGVIGKQTSDTDYTRFTGGAISAERLEAAAAAGIRNTGRQPQSPVHSRQWGKHVHRASATHQEWAAPRHDRILHRCSVAW
jgi:hypothetical protein